MSYRLFSQISLWSNSHMKHDIDERIIFQFETNLETLAESDSISSLDSDALVALFSMSTAMTAIRTAGHNAVVRQYEERLDVQRQRHLDIQADARQRYDRERQALHVNVETCTEGYRLLTKEHNATLATMRKLRTQIHELTATADDDNAPDDDDSAPDDDFAELMAAGLIPAESE